MLNQNLDPRLILHFPFAKDTSQMSNKNNIKENQTNDGIERKMGK